VIMFTGTFKCFLVTCCKTNARVSELNPYHRRKTLNLHWFQSKILCLNFLLISFQDYSLYFSVVVLISSNWTYVTSPLLKDKIPIFETCVRWYVKLLCSWNIYNYAGSFKPEQKIVSIYKTYIIRFNFKVAATIIGWAY
jgi:hypothetical protein